MANVTFNGTTKIITVNTGVTFLNVQEDLYSEWKAWIIEDGNASYLPAFRSVGGDELQDNYFLAPTFFLLNGWRIRPAEENATLTISGNLYVDGSTDSPFISTIGSYNVRINSLSSNIVNTVAIGSGVTSQDKTDIIEGVKTVLDPDISIMKGLMHHNFRMYNQVYNGNGKLLSATIRLYATPEDCENQVNHLHQYTIAATYDGAYLDNYHVIES